MIFLLFLFCVPIVVGAHDEGSTTGPNEEEIYKALFKHKRAEQLEAIKRILAIDDYAKQYKLVKLAFDQILKVMLNAKLVLEKVGYIPGGKFPEKVEVKEALANVIENTAFMGEILLRLPDVTHKILDSNNQVRMLVLWSMGFCEESSLLDATTKTLVSLMAQEMNIVPRDPNYVNPYSLKEKLKREDNEVIPDIGVSKKKKKKVKARGPQLSGVRQEL